MTSDNNISAGTKHSNSHGNGNNKSTDAKINDKSNIITNNNNNHHKPQSSSSPSSSSSSPPPSQTTTTSSPSSPSSSSSSSSSSSASTPRRRKRDITVKTSFNIRPSHIFIAVCVIIAAIIPLYVYDSPDQFLASVNSFFFPPILKSTSNNNNFNTRSSQSPHSKNSNSNSNSKSKTKQKQNSGGWRAAEPEILKKYDPGTCNIEKISVSDLTLDRFQKEFRYKKPVIVTFPNGASGWTEPGKWSLSNLKREYSQWTVRSGSSLEIVRKGGNGDLASSFTQFLDTIQNISPGAKDSIGGSKSYMFDRDFYFQSSLPRTLKLPSYFTANDADDDSIFFLGASLSGVVFHKHSDTWNGVVFGRKRWFLYPSKHTPPGGNYNGFTVLDWLANVYPRLSDAHKPTECVQEAGEIFYLPEGWYHATLNLGDTVAFAIQKKIPVLDTEILFYEATDLVNYIQGDSLSPENREIYTQLLHIYTELHQLLPESSEVMMKLGEQLYNLGQYSDSLGWYQSAMEKDPVFVMAYVHKGRALAKLQKYRQAENLLKKAVEISPNLWDVYKEYGEFLMNRGRHAHALPVFKKGTELMPGMIPFWYFYQQCQMKVGDVEGAEATQKVIARLKKRLPQE